MRRLLALSAVALLAGSSVATSTPLDKARGWATALVAATGDRWTEGQGVGNGNAASYTFTGRQAGRKGVGPVRGVVLACGPTGRRPYSCTGSFTQGAMRGSLFYTAGAGGGFTAKATLTRTAR